MSKQRYNECRIEFIAYGTLKEGWYNFNRFEGLEKVSDVEIPGYKMVSLGSYPAVFHTGDENDIIKAEIISAPLNSFHLIKRMEEGAMYNTVSISLNNKLYPIFEMDLKTVEYMLDKTINKIQTINEWTN